MKRYKIFTQTAQIGIRKNMGKNISRNGEMISRSLIVTSPSLLTFRIVNGGQNQRRRIQEITHSMKRWNLQALKRTSVITDKHECIAAKRFLANCRRLLQSMIIVRRRLMQQYSINNNYENNQRLAGGSGSDIDITLTADSVMLEKTTNHKLALFYTSISYLTPLFPSIGVFAWIAHHTTLLAVRLLRIGDLTPQRQIDHHDNDTRTIIATAIERRNTLNLANNGSNNDRFMTNVRGDWIAHDWIHLFELNTDFIESYTHLCILLQTLNNYDNEIAERRELRNRRDGREEDTEKESDNKIYSSIVFDHLFIWNNIIPLLTAVNATVTTTWFLPNLFIRKRQIERETKLQFERSQHTSAVIAAEKKIQHYKYSCSWIPNE